MNDERKQTFLLFALVIALLLFSSSLLIAVINLGGQIVASWLLIIIQGAIALLVLLVVFAVIGKFGTWVIAEIAALNRKHAELLAKIRERTPWFVVLMLLLSQAALAIADKSFKGNELPTVAVTLILILLFFIANEFMVSDSKTFKVLGFVLWFVAITALPFFVWADRGFNITAIITELAAFPLMYKIFYALCLPVFVLLPVLYTSRKDG